MERERKAAVKHLRLLALTQKGDIDNFRARIESEYASVILPNKVEVARRNVGGVVCDILSPELYSTRRIIFYIHGGSFVGGSALSYRGFCARLAHKTLCRVAIPDFRLSPDHAFPVSIKDVQNVFCALISEEQVSLSLDAAGIKGGALMPQIVLASDGSGASIAISLLTTLKAKYRQSVERVVFLSPWLDISDSSIVLSGRGTHDEVLNAEGMRRAVQLYAKKENRNSSLCSLPYCTPDMLSTFPPVFIQMGEKEILLEDAKRAKDIIEKAGGQCTLDVWPLMMHLFQLSDDRVDECHLAIDKIGKAVRNGDDEPESNEGEKRFFNQPPLEASL